MRIKIFKSMETTKGIEVGNWLFDKNGIPKQVTEIYDDSVTLGGELNHVSTINPIPLTEEIFEQNGIQYLFGRVCWQYLGIEEGFQVYFTTSCKLVVRYVHELQNLLKIFTHRKEIWLRKKTNTFIPCI